MCACKISETKLLRVATSEEGDRGLRMEGNPFFIASLFCFHCHLHYGKQRIAVGGTICCKLLFVLAFGIF